ncbi:hypothetical protein FOA52_006183 [Chlamydomonas sp. UWO 241]|nr:hypothetical protein FOA52_006183 [Chlamydomonas sp. UWO 241]
MWRSSLLLLPHRARAPVIVGAKKGSGGFGDEEKAVESRKRAPGKARRINVKRSESPIPGQGQARMPAAMVDVEVLDAKINAEEDDAEFAARLSLIKQDGADKASALGTPGTFPALQAAVFDRDDVTPKGDNMYANPPRLIDTLLSGMNEGVSDPKLKNAAIGPSQIGLAIGAILLAVVFLVVSGEDLTSSKRYRGVAPGVERPDAMEAAMLKSRISQLEIALEANPKDGEALEEEAVTYARLFEFDKAARLLDRLTKQQPDNGEAWRLLGETTLLMQQAGRSMAAYEQAAALQPNDIEVLAGFTDASIANNTQAQSIELLTKLKATAPDPPSPATSSAASGDASTSGKAAAPAKAAAAPAKAGLAAAPPLKAEEAADDGDAPSSTQPVDSVSLDLLLGKVYSSWRGHDNDTIATYDELIKRVPSDFRGYLAKGLFLKEQGRKADAERMFLQARYYAPQSRQAFIKEMSGSNPVIDLPDNN